jgi:hypothetical protein
MSRTRGLDDKPEVQIFAGLYHQSLPTSMIYFGNQTSSGIKVHCGFATTLLVPSSHAVGSPVIDFLADHFSMWYAEIKRPPSWTASLFVNFRVYRLLTSVLPSLAGGRRHNRVCPIGLDQLSSYREHWRPLCYPRLPEQEPGNTR